MPFRKFDASAKIAEKSMEDPNFKAAYEAIDKEYRIIEAVVELRKENGLTQKDIENMCGMTQQSISRLEKADVSTTLRNFIKYLDAAGLEIAIQKKSAKTENNNYVVI